MANQPSLTIGQHSEAGHKGHNEDSYGVLIPDQPLLATKGVPMAIADGMSGCEAGKEASETCVKGFFTDYLSTHESWAVKTSAARVLCALNGWLYGQGQARESVGRGMVSTFSGLVLKAGAAHIFHVGDTRIYRLRGESLEPLTNDHRLHLSRDRVYLSRAMGIDLNVDVDHRVVPVAAGDIFVFTTDGVHDHVGDAEILGTLRDPGHDPQSAARALVAAALAAGSPDDATCQIVRVDDPGMEDEDTHYRRLRELPFPPDLAPGMRLDGYRILRELHASNRTQIYLALDEAAGQRVVLKTPSVNYEDDPLYLDLFTREEWVGRHVDSPHVLKVLERTRRRRFLYTVTEHVEGQTLRQWMDDHPEPGLAQMREIVTQIAAGLRALHRREMVHRDLKPENVLIDKFGAVKIIDFGSTRIAGLEETALPAPEGPLGTAGYTAPEYLLGALGDGRGDIFSLGVIAYEMVTGRRPYGDGFSSAKAVEKLRYTPARRTNPAVPAWVDGALAKAVHRDPQHRYATLSEFVYDLSHPNPRFLEARGHPLLQRDPAAFWRAAALGLLAVTLALLYRIWGP